MSWCAPAVVEDHYLWVGFVQLLSPEWILAPPLQRQTSGEGLPEQRPKLL